MVSLILCNDCPPEVKAMLNVICRGLKPYVVVVCQFIFKLVTKGNPRVSTMVQLKQFRQLWDRISEECAIRRARPGSQKFSTYMSNCVLACDIPERWGWCTKVCNCDASIIPASVLFLLCFKFVCFVKPPCERKVSLQEGQM